MHNLPEAFARQMQDMLGADFPAFESALSSPPPVSINYNRAKLSAHAHSGEPVPWNPTGRYLSRRPSFTLDPLFHAGAYYVQEASSMFIAYLAAHIQGERPVDFALDLCAAPGGKTAILLNQLPESSIVVANEVIKTRYAKLRHNLAKWGRSNVIAAQADSKHFAPLKGQFDLVLTDAPCSGEGLFRKSPDAVQEWSEGNVQLCSARQGRILDNALPLVAPGGYLIYSTCTYNHYENDGRVRQALSAHDEFELAAVPVPQDWGLTATECGYQFFPHRVKGEGFYVALLRRKEANASVRAPKVALSYFAPAPKQSRQAVAHWASLADDDWAVLATPKQGLYLLPQRAMQMCSALAKALPRVDPGTPVGTLKGQQLVPAHELALSIHLSEDVPRCEASEEEALSFLRKAPFMPAAAKAKGWHLMTYQNQGLGWAKLLPNRLNNYFPNELRVRM